MATNFTIQFVPPRPDGSPSTLESVDLKLASDRRKYLRLLKHLDNDFLYRLKDMKWPPGPRGVWICFPLGPRTAICQWDEGEPDFWAQRRGYGTLTVMRIVSDEVYQAIRRQGERRWHGTGDG